MPPRTTKTKSQTTKSSKTKAPRAKAPAKAEPTPTVEVPEVVESTPTPTQSTSSRRMPTKEVILEEFDQLLEKVNVEIENLRNSSGKVKGVKFLRSLKKNLETLRSRSSRVMKSSKPKRVTNTNSGFHKKVPVSKDFAKFAGWDPSEKYSRVDVTRYICDYIRQHDLQNPDNRREILVENDRKLNKLLKYDENAEGKKLTYPGIQKCLKNHFPKE